MELMSSIERSMPTEGIPVCTTHEIRHEVEAFLASLSLGITRRDADLEDAIADKLHSLFHDCANLQHKLNQWVAVAMGLQEVIQQQEHPKHVQLSPDQADAVTGQLPSGHALEAAMAAQHREVAALQAQMAMLSHDMTALRQSSSASRAPQLPSFKQVAAEYKDLQRLHDEAASLRHALQDAELEMQRMTDTHRRELEDAAKREQAERARAAAEVLAAQHQATVLRAKLQQHAASPGSLHALPSLQATAGGAMPEGHDVVASLRVKRQELLEEVSKMQDYLASVQHSTALEQAHQLAQQALQQEIEDLHSSHAQAMAREQQLREAAAQELLSFKEVAAAQHTALTQQVMALTEQLQATLAQANAAADRGQALQAELEREASQRTSLEAQLAHSSAEQAAAQRLQPENGKEIDERAADVEAGLGARLAAAEEAGVGKDKQILQLRGQLHTLEAASAQQLHEEGAQLVKLQEQVQQLQSQLETQAASATEQLHVRDLQQGHIRELERQLQSQSAALAEERQKAREREAERAAALEGAHAEAESLRAQLAALQDAQAAESHAALIDSHARHSEALEQLQQEHEQEVTRLSGGAEADREHMHAVNAMLRTELSAALARLAAADSPPTASRPCSAPQQADSSAAAQHAACLPQPGAPDGSQKQENSDTAQPAAQATVSLSQTDGYSTRGKPEGRVHQTSLSHGPCLDRAGLGDASCRIRMTQRGSVNHAQQPQRALAEAAKEERAGCLEAPLPAQALGSNPIVVLATLAALQQHFRQQLASTHAARSADSAIYPHQLPNEEGSAAASVAKTGAQHEVAAAVQASEARLQDQHTQELAALEQRLHEELGAAQKHQKETYDIALGELAAKHQADVKRLKIEHERQMEEGFEDWGRQLKEALEEQHADEIQDLQLEHADEIAELNSQHKDAIEITSGRMQAQYAAGLELLEHQHTQGLAQMSTQLEQKLSQQLAQQHAQELAQMKIELESQLQERHAQNELVLRGTLAQEHAQELAEAQARLEAEHQGQQAAAEQALREQLAEEYAQELAQMRAQLEARLQEQHAASERLHEESKAKLALAQELAAEQHQVQLQEQADETAAVAQKYESQLQALRKELATLQRQQEAASLHSHPSTPRKAHAELVRLRQECGQLRADWADLLAQCQAASSELAAAKADNAALRQENLELAGELTEASRERHAKEDAHHMLHERCSELQDSIERLSRQGSAQGTPVRQHAGHAGGTAQPAQRPVNSQRASAASPREDLRPDSTASGYEAALSSGGVTPASSQGPSGSAEQAQQAGRASRSAAPAAAAGAGSRPGLHLQLEHAAAAGHLTHEDSSPDLAALEGHCPQCCRMESQMKHLQTQYEEQLAQLNADIKGDARALRISNQDLALTLRATGTAEQIEVLEAERDRLAALADDSIAELEAMKSENIHLSSGAVMHEEERHSFKSALAKLKGALQERDAEVAELQERLAQLRALEQERGLPTPGSSDTPRVIAAQLRIEQLQRQLREALHATPHALSFSPAQTAAVTTPGVSGEQDGSMEELAQKHAAEVASLQAAFRARLAAAEEDLQAKSEQILALEHALVLAEEALAARQEALGECQDMLAEMQGFSEAQRHRADQERAQAQAAQNMALAAQAAAQAAAAQLQGAEAQVRSCRRRTHDAEAAIAAKGEALEEATLTNHHLQLELGEARGQLRAAKAASHAAYERVEVLTAQLAAMEAGSPLGLIFRSFRDHRLSSTGTELTDGAVDRPQARGRRHSSPGGLAPARRLLTPAFTRPARLSLGDIGNDGEGDSAQSGSRATSLSEGAPRLSRAWREGPGSSSHRRQSSPGALAPAQRPARFSLADVSDAQLDREAGTLSGGARSLSRTWGSRGEMSQQRGDRPGSESPIKRRRWTHTGEVKEVDPPDMAGTAGVLSDQENACDRSPVCPSPPSRSTGLRVPAGRPAGYGAQESPEPLGSVHFNALYGEARLSDSPLRKPPLDHSTLSKLRHLPDGSADATLAQRPSNPIQKLPIDQGALIKARRHPPDTSEATEIELAQSAHSDAVLSHEARIRAYAPEEEEALSPENRPRVSSKVAAQRAIFSEPVPRKPEMPTRDIAGRWHGHSPVYWSACCTP